MKDSLRFLAKYGNAFADKEFVRAAHEMGLDGMCLCFDVNEKTVRGLTANPLLQQRILRAATDARKVCFVFFFPCLPSILHEFSADSK